MREGPRSVESIPGGGGPAAHPLIDLLKREQGKLAGRLKSFNRLIDAGAPLDEIGRAAHRLLASQARYIGLRTEAVFPPLERALGQELPFVNSYLDMWRSQAVLLEQVAARAAEEDREWGARHVKLLIGQARDLMWKEANILYPVLERAFPHRVQLEIVESISRHLPRGASLRAQPRSTSTPSAIGRSLQVAGPANN